jgi:hypothetical protein
MAVLKVFVRMLIGVLIDHAITLLEATRYGFVVMLRIALPANNYIAVH